MTVTTQERSSNHVAGVVATNLEIAPQAQCFTGRFAATGNTIRSDAENVLFGKAGDNVGYDVMGDTLVLLVRGGADAINTFYDAYFFKRR